MAILPNNTDPSKDYVIPGYSPALTADGLVYNRIYAQTGVIDALKTTKKTGYTDPSTSIINGLNNSTTFDQALQQYWISSQQFGGDSSVPVVLTYNMSTPTYYNNINFSVLNVPCYVEIGYYDAKDNWNALPGVSTYVINGGSDIHTTTDWLYLSYSAPSTQNTGNASNNSLSLRITRNQNVQTTNTPLPTSIAYSVGVDNFSIKLQVQTATDVPTSVISGTSNIIAQNRFGFIENYSYSNNPVNNVFNNDNTYWKCAPQPTGDSIVYFYALTGNITTNATFAVSGATVNSATISGIAPTRAMLTGTNTPYTVPSYDDDNNPLDFIPVNTAYLGYQDTNGKIVMYYPLISPINFDIYAQRVGSVYTTTMSSPLPYLPPSGSKFILSDGSMTPNSINRLYFDPLYSGCKFNIYFTTDYGYEDPSAFKWTPIQRDFVLRKGIYELPNISCTYLKFEFTQLIPEIYDLPFDSITKVINVFPPDVEQYYSDIESSILNANSVQYSNIGNNNNPQSATTNNINSSTLFGTASNTLANQNSWPQLSALNVSQLGNTTTMANNSSSYVIDPTSSYKLLDANGRYNNASYTQFLQRRFPYAGTHKYTQITLDQTWHESYFTGIKYLTAFYEQQYDDLRGTPKNLTSNLGTTSGFLGQNINYVSMNPDDYAVTPWFSTIDKFKSFNIGALTSDWNSFLTDAQVLMNDKSVLSTQYYTNAVGTSIGKLGTSTIVQISQSVSGFVYGMRSPNYPQSNNQASYNDANFISYNNWHAVSGTTGVTITPTTVTWVSGTISGTSSGININNNSYTVGYNFTLPGVYSNNGVSPWTVQFGTAEFGSVGYGVYNPLTDGVHYYFYVGAQVSGTSSGFPSVTTSLSCYTQFINPTTGSGITGTLVSGNTTSFTSGTSGSNLTALTGTNFNSYASFSGIPSNTIQFVISGSTSNAYNLYQFGTFQSPTSTWMSPQDRNNMRVSANARIFLPFTDKGTYRVSLYANNPSGSLVELAYKQFTSGTLPLNTWFDVELETFTGFNYSGFYVSVIQTDVSVSEVFYISMLSPFYHPIRFEYTNISGSNYPNNYQYITGKINDPTYFVNTSGTLASGIQVRMTALDPNAFISGLSVIPYYKQSPYYAELNIDYIGNSKTNETSSRRSVANKPYFQLNGDIFPQKFSITQVVGTNTPYAVG